MNVEEESTMQAEVLLSIVGAKLGEVHQGVLHPVLEDVEMIVISVVPNAQELELARLQLSLPEGALGVADGRPLVFVLVGDYKIPLNIKVPCLRAGSTDFTFVVPNLFINIVLPSSIPPEDLDAFEMLIRNYGVLRDKPGSQVEVKAPLSTRIASGITKVAGVAVAGIEKGTAFVATGVDKGTDKIVEHTDKCEKPVQVPQQIKTHLSQARTVTKGAVLVSTGLAASLLGVSSMLGGVIGSRISQRVPGANNSKLDGVKEVGVATIGGVGAVFIAATDAARTLLCAGTRGISKVVRHKLGDDAGDTTTEGFGLVEDVVTIQQNMKNAGVKGLMRQTARHTGKKVLEDLKKSGSE